MEADVDTHKNRSASWGLLILRVVVGAVFVMHGGQKLFVTGLPGFAGMVMQLGIPLPNAAAVVVALVEFVGGALLIAGLFARPVAALIAIDMVVAVLTVHLHNGFFLPRGYEFALTQLGANLALILLGAGAWSIDGWVAGGRSAGSGQSASGL
jgi:putative oxidoreductase